MSDQVPGVGLVIFMAVVHPWSQQIGPSPPLIVVLFQARINKIEKFEELNIIIMVFTFKNLIYGAQFLISFYNNVIFI